ncbi:calponin homology domain-containing protein DDB_G0272472 [Dunckerocampus dactyliophorus]|uniref:calponin homology domain-containing protein DDB_G0272472 n=1 Tax=Dunckerocampus dactyliophorus TaxID=161453 RepID=UPI002405830F|nr:calponin homology domain-containing protein DDB_G0272472 [Dunckerocampus dactyliophorus]XP_054629477.1 calponin homology domain-containing protein DDB_G0272472 [Dunckerocampus dactyliophorus]
MAAQVEVQSGEVGRTGTGGRLHLSPLTDSINTSPPMSQTHIITPEPKKPVPGPKPRLTPKPFAVEKQPTIKPIPAPKPHTKPRPVSTHLAGYKPDIPCSPKPQQPVAIVKPSPMSTSPSHPTSTSFKTSIKVNTGQTTKPVAPPFKAAPPLDTVDTIKPTPPLPPERQKHKNQKTPMQSGASIARAKSLGFLNHMDKEEEISHSEALVPPRPKPRGSKPRPVSAVFLYNPETPLPTPRLAEGRPLSSDMTFKFETIGLSLHHKMTKTNNQESPMKEEALPQKPQQQTNSTLAYNSDDEVKPVASDEQTNKNEDKISVKETEEDQRGFSVKSRINLLLESSSAPETVSAGRTPDIPSQVQRVPDSEPQVGVKQRIKQLTDDTATQSPVLKPAVKLRSLPSDLTKKFSSEKASDFGSVSHSAETEYHDISKEPQRRIEPAAVNASYKKDSVDIQDQISSMTESPAAGQPFTSTIKQSSPSVEVQTVRASIFDNIVERSSVLMVDKRLTTAPDSLSSPSLRRGSSEDEGTLVTATYKDSLSPSSLRVNHAMATVKAVGESRAVSESILSGQREDKAMTLRSRRSEGKTSLIKGEPASAVELEQQPRYLRIRSLQKWASPEAGVENETLKQSHKEKEIDLSKDRQREAEQEETAAAPKRLKTLQIDEKSKPKATYFALTGQIQGSMSPLEVGADIISSATPYNDYSIGSGQGSSQGKVSAIKRNLSLNETFGKKHLDKNVDAGMISHISLRQMASAMDVQTAEKITEVKREQTKEDERQNGKIKTFEREKHRQIEIEKQAILQFSQMKEREIQREFERQKAFEREKQSALVQQKQRQLKKLQELEFEKQRQLQLEKETARQQEQERQQELERQRELEKQKQQEMKRQREQELERQHEQVRLKEQEKERQRELQRQQELMKLKQLENERQKELEKQREMERQQEQMRFMEQENERQQEFDRQQELMWQREQETVRQRELERQRELIRLKEQEKQRELQRQQEQLRQREHEMERQRELMRQRELEKERWRELDRQQEQMRLREQEKQRQQELEQERNREWERQRQREEAMQRELDKETRLMEMQRNKQRMEDLERIKEIEAEKLLDFEKQKQKEKERQKLEKQRLKEKMDREKDKIKQMALEQEMLRLKEIDKEREKQKQQIERQHEEDIEREKLKELEKQKDLKREKLWREAERIKEIERIQLMEFEMLNQIELDSWHTDIEEHKIRENMEKAEAEKMRQVAKLQEAERHRLKEKQRKEEQEKMRLEQSPLRPKVFDLDSVVRTATSHHTDPSLRWKEPSPIPQTYKPAIFDVDSFTSQSRHPSSQDLLPVASIQEVNSNFDSVLRPASERDITWKVPPRMSVDFTSPVWTMSPQDPWELQPSQISHPTKVSPDHILHRKEQQFLASQNHWPHRQGQPLYLDPFAQREAATGGVSSSAPVDQVWLPRELKSQDNREKVWNHRRSQGSQELNRMRSRSMSRRSAPSSGALEGSIYRIRSRSAHREQDHPSWVQQKQSVSGEEEEGKDSETPVGETDSQYGTWETGLRTDDSLTPATPNSESNLSPSPRNATHSSLLQGQHASQLDADIFDSLHPSSSSESQPFSFPDAPTTLLDNSALRSRVQLGKKRAPRTRPSRAARQCTTDAGREGATSDNWIYQDSTEKKVESKMDEVDSKEQARAAEAGAAVASQPQRIALFPGVDPLALKVQLKKRSDSDSQTDAPSPSLPSRSPKSPFLPRAARVLPPAGGKENGEEESPKWLKELKSKKRLSHYENEN